MRQSAGQQFVYFTPVKTYDDVFIDDDYGYTHLTGLLYHLLDLVAVLGDIMLGIGNAFLRKILFRLMAVGSGGGAVNRHILFRHSDTSLPYSRP